MSHRYGTIATAISATVAYYSSTYYRFRHAAGSANRCMMLDPWFQTSWLNLPSQLEILSTGHISCMRPTMLQYSTFDSHSSFSVTQAHIQNCCAPVLKVSLAGRQNLKLAWEDAWNHGRTKLSVKWLLHIC